MGKTPSNTEVRFWRDPDLPGVEIRYSSYKEETFRSHKHSAYSIGVIETGRTTFKLDEESNVASESQIVFIGPEVVHACNPDPDTRMTYLMFYVAPPLLKEVADEVYGPGEPLPSFPDAVVDDPGLRGTLHALHQAVSDGAEKLEKESLLVQALADSITRHGQPGRQPRPGGGPGVADKVKGYLTENLTEKVTLDDLSRISDVSRYHLLRVFQAATGLPPHAYQNQLRVDLGRTLLADGHAISQVAVEVGFSDQSHFSKVFRQYTGATPKQYQEANRA